MGFRQVAGMRLRRSKGHENQIGQEGQKGTGPNFAKAAKFTPVPFWGCNTGVTEGGLRLACFVLDSGLMSRFWWLIVMAGVLLAQHARPKFEVASVKPVRSEAHGGAVVMREFSNGRVSVEAPAYSLVQAAYGLRWDQMLGGPAWTHNDYYSVTAKAERPVGASEMWPMMATLLEDRFHLKTHRETRQMPVYKLSVASGGLKVRQVACASWEEHAPPPAPAHGARFALPCGKLIAYLIDQGTAQEFVGGKISMSSLAEFLTRHLRHPVVDETGYKGTFDVDVKLSSDESWGRVSSDPDPSGLPTTAGALRELGIKLELVKGPVGMFVIDSIDRPSAN